MKISVKNQQRSIRADQRKLKDCLNKALRQLGLKDAEVSVLLVNDRRMRALNFCYRGVDRTTDVLSFPQVSPKALKLGSQGAEKSKLPDVPPPASRRGDRTSELLNSGGSLLLGDIVVNLHQAKRQSVECGHSLGEEMVRLLLHGLLHLAGYDHEKSAYAGKKMRAKESELLKRISGSGRR